MARNTKPEMPKAYTQERKRQGWKPRGSAPLKWETGMEVEGIYRALLASTNAKSSPVLVIDTENGSERYWCPTVLASRLTEFQPDDPILIVCLGKTLRIESRGGAEAWDFEVYGK